VVEWRGDMGPGAALLLAVLCATVAPTLAAQATRVALPTPYLAGYAHPVSGEVLAYHSPIPGVGHSLLVRSEDSTRVIVWETAPVPAHFAGDTAVFVLMAGIDVNEDRRAFTLTLDGRAMLTFYTPPSAGPGTITWTGAEGVRADLRVTLMDKYGDAMGYVFLHVPRRLLRPGAPVRLAVAGESAGRRTWFMVFMEPITPRVEFRNAPAVVRAPEGERQALRVDVLYLGERGRLHLASPSATRDTVLNLGFTRLQLVVPAVREPTTIPLELTVDGWPAATRYVVQPVRRLDLYLIHHTHLDIGYTHRQDEVERMHWQHLERALAYGAASDTFPEGERFVWHPEGLWAVESYLATHSPAERARLIEGIRRGWIHLDGLFANLLTGLATEEGLDRALETGRRLSALTGVPIVSAMTSDIPGFSWGLVPALAHAGIRYLSIGPNQGHRIGSFLKVWGDHPFYWESASGRERVLTWVHGAGYSWFHTGLGYERLTTILDEENVFRYLDQLDETQYPYAIAALRYNIGSDNGPPDATLAQAVRSWNERYASPRLIIGTTTGLLAAFERRYGAGLPVVRGDLTGYWEDGAASSARETARTRRTAESLTETEQLAGRLGVALDSDAVYAAWRQVLLFYEHTWGSWNSISEPDIAFTREQWERKRAFADSAAMLADELRATVLQGRAPAPGVVTVLNPSGWPRSELVLLDPTVLPGERVLDETGAVMPSQRLASGELAFVAAAVPAGGARHYRLTAGRAPPAGPVPRGAELDNGIVRLELDTTRGTIRSLRRVDQERELVPAGDGMNQYLYVPGRNPRDAVPSGPARVTVTDAGPVVWSVVSRAPAAGTSGDVETRVRLVAGSDRVEIVNRFDKTRVYTPEAVLFRFPLAVDDAETRISAPGGAYTVERQQPPGANRNYFSVERWVDQHDATGGVTLVSIDVPVVGLGSIGTDAVVVGWRDHVDPAPVLFSYVMNNYWETNYRAWQAGPHAFRYVLRPHGRFDETEAERLGVEVARPLIVMYGRR
jgi:alpha-mannosidase